MKLKEFQEAASRTLILHELHDMNVNHMSLGMCSELSEIEDALEVLSEIPRELHDLTNLNEEMGDVLWYCALAIKLQGYDIDRLFTLKVEQEKSLDWYIHEYANLVKRLLYYKKAIDPAKEEQLLAGILQTVNNYCEEAEQSLEGILTKNIAKLYVRYPEKFTEFLAQNRNLEEELKALK